MKIRKSFAGIAAGSLALAGLAVVSAPAAQAYSGNTTLPGSLFLSNTPSATNATTNNTYNDTFSLTQAPASPNAGQLVTVTLSGATGALSGPVPVTANSFIVRGTVTLAGAQTGDISLTSGAACNYPATPIGTNTAQGPWSITGTYTASGNGAASISLKQIFFDDQGNLDGSVANVCAGSGSNADYYASAVTQTAGSGQPGLAKTAPAVSSVITQAFTTTGPNAAIVTSSGQNAGVQAVRMSAAYTSTVVLSGSVFGANAAVGQVTASFCDSTGASCVNPGYSDTNSLSVTGGALSGAILHVPGTPGPTTGSRAIKIVNTVDNATALVPVLVLGTATVSASPASFGPGATVVVTGSNFNPGQAITIYGSSLQAPPYTTTGDAAVSAGNATASGALSATNFVAASPSTASIVAYQGIPGAPAASNPSGAFNVTINADTCTRQVGSNTPTLCETKQNITATVNAGALTQTAVAFGVGYTSTSIPFGAVTTAVTAGTLTANLNPITVADARGGSTGWSLTAAMPGLTEVGGGTIANANLSTTSVSCAGNAVGSATGNVAGAASQTFSGTVTLCTKNTTADSAGGTSGGQYLVNAGLSLNVPAFQKAGAYTSTITVTLT